MVAPKMKEFPETGYTAGYTECRSQADFFQGFDLSKAVRKRAADLALGGLLSLIQS